MLRPLGPPPTRRIQKTKNRFVRWVGLFLIWSRLRKRKLKRERAKTDREIKSIKEKRYKKEKKERTRKKIKRTKEETKTKRNKKDKQ